MIQYSNSTYPAILMKAASSSIEPLQPS